MSAVLLEIVEFLEFILVNPLFNFIGLLVAAYLTNLSEFLIVFSYFLHHNHNEIFECMQLTAVMNVTRAEHICFCS